MSSKLDRLNGLSRKEAMTFLLSCCASRRWAGRMADRRPFPDAGALFAVADEIWRSLAPEDWCEAFAGHPRIGDVAGAKGWSRQEQAGVAGASGKVLEEIARGNREYEARFGHVFLVCASGRSAEEMLALLRERLHNDSTRELAIAAEEQRKITRIRLEKLLEKP